MEKIKWSFDTRPLSELKPWLRNPRVINEKGLKDLDKSIDRFGLADPLIINQDKTIIGGHARYQVLLRNGVKEAACAMPNRQLSNKELAELAIRLNKNVAGKFDYEILAQDYESDFLVDIGFEADELIIDGDSELDGVEGKDKSTDKSTKETTIIKCPACGEKFGADGNKA